MRSKNNLEINGRRAYVAPIVLVLAIENDVVLTSTGEPGWGDFKDYSPDGWF